MVQYDSLNQNINPTLDNPNLYWPEHFDIKTNDWIYTLNEIRYSPSYQSRIDYKQELEKYRVAQAKIVDACRLLNVHKTVIFTAMIYLERFYQRASMQNTSTTFVSASCLYLACKKLELHRSVKHVASAFAKVQFNRNKMEDVPDQELWTYRDAIIANEDNVLELLCFDLKLTNPYKFLDEILSPKDHDYSDLKGYTLSKIEALTTSQIFLLFKIEQVVISFLLLCAFEKKSSFPKDYFKNINLSIDPKEVLEVKDMCDILFEEHELPILNLGSILSLTIEEADVQRLIEGSDENLPPPPPSPPASTPASASTPAITPAQTPVPTPVPTQAPVSAPVEKEKAQEKMKSKVEPSVKEKVTNQQDEIEKQELIVPDNKTTKSIMTPTDTLKKPPVVMSLKSNALRQPPQKKSTFINKNSLAPSSPNLKSPARSPVFKSRIGPGSVAPRQSPSPLKGSVPSPKPTKTLSSSPNKETQKDETLSVPKKRTIDSTTSTSATASNKRRQSSSESEQQQSKEKFKSQIEPNESKASYKTPNPQKKLFQANINQPVTKAPSPVPRNKPETRRRSSLKDTTAKETTDKKEASPPKRTSGRVSKKSKQAQSIYDEISDLSDLETEE